MLGFDRDAGRTARLTAMILQDVITELDLPRLPSELHHFTSPDVAGKIIEKDDVRLSHAEYSNDQTEIKEAKRMIDDLLVRRSKKPFFEKVLESYRRLSKNLDVYILCMSSGLPDKELMPQDILSQWRAYGHDGRGICLTLDAKRLARLVYNTPCLRINPVIYDRKAQRTFVHKILNRALELSQSNERNVHEVAAAALVFVTPLLKAAGFAEEKEWRLMYVPPGLGISPKLSFHLRRDFLAPYIKLRDVCNDLGPKMMRIPELVETLPLDALRPAPHIRKLVPITKIMIGPSSDQSLNERAFIKITRQARIIVDILKSQIPYRSFA